MFFWKSKKNLLDLNFENYKNTNMKNLITVIALFFAFTIGAFAQDSKKEDPKVSAKKELQSLSKVIEIDNSIALALNDLLIYKHETVNRFPEKKEEVAATIESKLKSTFTAEQFLKIKNNKTLFEDLIY